MRLQSNLQRIRQSLEDGVQAAAWSGGQGMTIERAIEYALVSTA